MVKNTILSVLAFALMFVTAAPAMANWPMPPVPVTEMNGTIEHNNVVAIGNTGANFQKMGKDQTMVTGKLEVFSQQENLINKFEDCNCFGTAPKNMYGKIHGNNVVAIGNTGLNKQEGAYTFFGPGAVQKLTTGQTMVQAAQWNVINSQVTPVTAE